MACKYFIDGKQLSEQEVKSYISDKYIDSKDIKFTTLDDIANILAYSNSKIILDGWKVEYQTPLGNKYDTLEEVNNEIRGLADADVEVDLSDVDLSKGNQQVPENLKWEFENQGKTYKELIENKQWKVSDGTGKTQIVANQDYKGDKGGFWWDGENYYHKSNLTGKKTIIPFKEFLELFSKINQFGINKDKLYQDRIVELSEWDNKKINPLLEFLDKNKEYEQSKEIIEEWKKENNIQYDPEEVYSRGQGFYSSIGAYSNLELDLLFQNLLQHIEDNKKAGGEFTISAFTKPIDKRLKHIEGTGDRVRFVIYPKSNDIKWAAPTDVYSGSVWDANTKVSTDKKSELLGVSYTKSPSLNNVNKISPNLSEIIDSLEHAHNELAIELTEDNFEIEFDENIDYSTKQLIDSINKIIQQKRLQSIENKINQLEKQCN